MTWQPIATAHKSDRLLVSYIDESGCWEVGIGIWWLGDEWTVSCEETTVTPTHWMPLPAPPSTRKEQTMPDDLTTRAALRDMGVET